MAEESIVKDVQDLQDQLYEFVRSLGFIVEANVNTTRDEFNFMNGFISAMLDERIVALQGLADDIPLTFGIKESNDRKKNGPSK